jgi:hypothetical protein
MAALVSLRRENLQRNNKHQKAAFGPKTRKGGGVCKIPEITKGYK